MKIKYKILFWFILIGMTPVLLAVVLFYKNIRLSTEYNIFTNLNSVADLKKRELKEWIVEKIVDLKMVINDDDIVAYSLKYADGSSEIKNGFVDNNDFKHAVSTIANLKHNNNYNRVVLLDSAGKVLLSTNQEDIGKNLTDDFIKTILRNKSVEIKDIFYDKNNQALMSFGGPIFRLPNDENINRTEVLGVLFFEVKMKETVFSILEHWSKAWQTGEMIIGKRDKDKLVFLSKLKHINQSPLNFIITRAEKIGLPMWFATSGEGITRAIDYNGVDVLAAYRNIPIMNWGFVVKIDESEAFSQIFILRKQIIFIFVILIFILMMLAWVVSGLVYLPINSLRRGIEIIEKGDLEYSVGTNDKDEIGELSRSFDKMVWSLKKSLEEVDHKVKLQTKQIIAKDKKLANKQKALLNVLEDVEEEKKLTSQERDNLNTVLSSIGDGVLAMDIDYKIIIFNQAATVISGFSAEDVIGKNYGDVLKFIDQKTGLINSSFITDAISFGKTSLIPEHTLLTKKDGSSVVVADIAAPLKDISGKIRGCVVAFRDATRESEVDRMKTEFVSLASHQLNTPLTGIKWFLELLIKGKAGKLSKQQEEFAQQAASSNDRMIKLVADLLNISHIESGSKFVIEKKLINIITLIKTVIIENLILAKKTNRNLTITLSNNTPKKLMVNIDSLKIIQVLNNLINNAVKYADNNSEIKIDLVNKKNEVVFSVKNKGVGIPLKQQRRIFEKFFRGANIITKEAVGNGLGLYIAKSIIETHGGKMWFESVPNKETTFYFSLLK